VVWKSVDSDVVSRALVGYLVGQAPLQATNLGRK